MNKLFFRLLVLLMSLSLIGIILVQVYWFNTSFKNNEEQFRFHVKQVIGNVADKLEKEEAYSFIDKYKKLKDSREKKHSKTSFLPGTHTTACVRAGCIAKSKLNKNAAVKLVLSFSKKRYNNTTQDRCKIRLVRWYTKGFKPPRCASTMNEIVSMGR